MAPARDYGAGMNKSQLVDALADRLGGRQPAAAAVDAVLETIVSTVSAGDTVTIVGFGVFEGRARAARTARNPRSGAAVAVPATTVPAFRPGAGFRTAVAGGSTTGPGAGRAASRPAPRPSTARRSGDATFVATDAPAAAPAKPAKGAKAGKAPKAKAAPAPAAAAEKRKAKKAKAKK